MNTDTARARPKGLSWSLVLPGLLLVLFSLAGCSQPQVSHDNWELLSSLRTACSAQNAEWLAQNEAEILRRQQAGTLSAEELAEFQEILRLARDGRWEKAEARVLKWQRAQRPPAAIERKLPAPKPLPENVNQ